jgi:hypothetical protein
MSAAVRRLVHVPTLVSINQLSEMAGAADSGVTPQKGSEFVAHGYLSESGQKDHVNSPTPPSSSWHMDELTPLGEAVGARLPLYQYGEAISVRSLVVDQDGSSVRDISPSPSAVSMEMDGETLLSVVPDMDAAGSAFCSRRVWGGGLLPKAVAIQATGWSVSWVNQSLPACLPASWNSATLTVHSHNGKRTAVFPRLQDFVGRSLGYSIRVLEGAAQARGQRCSVQPFRCWG